MHGIKTLSYDIFQQPRRQPHANQPSLHTASRKELCDGNLAQASWNVWEAVSHRLTEIAERRGWKSNQVRDLSVAVDRLAEETDNPKSLSMWFSISVTSYTNSSDDYKPEDFVRLDIRDAKKLIAMLDEIEDAAN